MASELSGLIYEGYGRLVFYNNFQNLLSSCFLTLDQVFWGI